MVLSLSISQGLDRHQMACVSPLCPRILGRRGTDYQPGVVARHHLLGAGLDQIAPTSLRGVPKQVSGRRRKRIPLARLCDYGPLGMGWRLRKISNYPCRPEIEHRGVGYVEK
jgi:hypothetical protein